MRLDEGFRVAGADEHPDLEALHAFVDREATPSETLRISRHLGVCPDCDRLGEDFASLAEDLASLPGAEVPQDFTLRVMNRVASLPAPVRRRPHLRLAGAAVALLIVLAASMAHPWTIRAAQGLSRWLPTRRFAPGEILDVLLALGAAAVATLGRAAENLGPWTTGPEVAPGSWLMPHVPLMLLLVALATALVGMALAGGGLLRLWFYRGDRATEPTD